MKAIETEYRGHLFRSRLEARWAVFFDHMEIVWEYEAQGFSDGGDVRYLPDFHLTEIGHYVEVKGAEPSPAEIEKMARFATDLPAGHRLICLGEVPDPKNWVLHQALGATADPNGIMWFEGWFGFEKRDGKVQPTFHSPGDTDVDAWLDIYRRLNVSGRVAPNTSRCVDTPNGYPMLTMAYRSARSARFEHGADPRPDRFKPR